MVEVLYVVAVTALGKREGWSIPTGVIHPSAEEAQETDTGTTRPPEVL
jgi:hypothetical protein